MDALTIKKDLTTHELQLLDSEFQKRKKSVGATWLLWLFLGGIGAHRYYLGKIGTAIIMTLTLGCLGVWTLIDAFLIMPNIRKANERLELEILKQIQSQKSVRTNDEAAVSKE